MEDAGNRPGHVLADLEQDVVKVLREVLGGPLRLDEAQRLDHVSTRRFVSLSGIEALGQLSASQGSKLSGRFADVDEELPERLGLQDLARRVAESFPILLRRLWPDLVAVDAVSRS